MSTYMSSISTTCLSRYDSCCVQIPHTFYVCLLYKLQNQNWIWTCFLAQVLHTTRSLFIICWPFHCLWESTSKGSGKSLISYLQNNNSTSSRLLKRVLCWIWMTSTGNKQGKPRGLLAELQELLHNSELRKQAVRARRGVLGANIDGGCLQFSLFIV